MAEKVARAPFNIKGEKYAWLIVANCFLILFGSVVMFNNCLGLFMLPVSEALGIPITKFAVCMTLTFLPVGILSPFAGIILRKLPTRPTVCIAITIECLMYFLNGFWTDISQFYVSSIIIGIFNAVFSFLLVPFLVNHWFREHVGLAVGIAYLGTNIGGCVWFIVGGIIINNLGYQWCYRIFGIIAFVLAVPFSLIFMRRRPEDIGLKPLGAAKREAEGIQTTMVGYTLREAIKMPSFWILWIFVITLTLAVAFNVQLTTFAQMRGYNIAVAGLVTAVSIGIGGTIGNVSAGRLADKIGCRASITVVGIIGIIGLLVMRFATGSVLILAIGSILFGILGAQLDMSATIMTRALYGPLHFDKIYPLIVWMTPFTNAAMSPIFAKMVVNSGSYNGVLTVCTVGPAIAIILCWCLCTAAQRKRQQPGSKADPLVKL